MATVRIGDVVTWIGPGNYEFEGRVAAFARPLRRGEAVDDDISDIDACDVGGRWCFCSRTEATHLTAFRGVSAFIAPIAEVQVIGRVAWPAAQIRSERVRAKANHGRWF